MHDEAIYCMFFKEPEYLDPGHKHSIKMVNMFCLSKVQYIMAHAFPSMHAELDAKICP